MRACALLSLIVVLAACGVDGDPVPPGQEDETAEDAAVTKTTTSAVISVGSGGHGGAATTVSRGNVSVTLGTGF